MHVRSAEKTKRQKFLVLLSCGCTSNDLTRNGDITLLTSSACSMGNMKDAPAIQFDKENILAMEKLKYVVLEKHLSSFPWENSNWS